MLFSTKFTTKFATKRLVIAVAHSGNVKAQGSRGFAGDAARYATMTARDRGVTALTALRVEKISLHMKPSDLGSGLSRAKLIGNYGS